VIPQVTPSCAVAGGSSTAIAISQIPTETTRRALYGAAIDLHMLIFPSVAFANALYTHQSMYQLLKQLSLPAD
jgi:hypothetical protein